MEAAYVLPCGRGEARAISSEDPLVANGIMTAACAEWQLVGINPEAIDAAAVLSPRRGDRASRAH
jgi:hypothetical protein